MPRGLEPQGLRQRELLERIEVVAPAGTDVVRGSLDDFKTVLFEELTKHFDLGAEDSSDDTDSRPSVYLIRHPDDREAALIVREALDDVGLECHVSGEEARLIWQPAVRSSGSA